MKTPTTWGDITHQFLQSGVTYPARSISATQSGAKYHFTRYNTYTAEAGGIMPGDLGPSGGNLVGWWKLDAANGGTDLSGNGNNGSAQGGLVFGTATDHKGVANAATSFDGVGNWVSCGPASVNILNSGPDTVTLWLKNISNSSLYAVVSEFGNTSPRWHVVVSSSSFHGYYADTGADDCWHAVNLNDGSWHFIAVVRNGTNITGYFDGSTVTSISDHKINVSNNSNSCKIGSEWGNAGFIQGLVSDVRIYNRALSTAEIQQLYNQ